MTIFKCIKPDVEIPVVPLPHFLLKKFAEFGDKPALIDGPTGFTLTFKQLSGLMVAVSRNLRDNFGFNTGNVLAIYMPNHPLYAPILHGTTLTGAAVTTINPLYTVEELQKQLNDSKATLLVTIPLFLEKAIAATNEGKTGVTTIFVVSKDPVEPPKDSKISVVDVKALFVPPKDTEIVKANINPKEDTLFVPYSSGTTGLNKGVVLTHYNMVANVVQCEDFLYTTADDVLLGLLPFYHIYAIMVILAKALCLGTTVVCMPKFDLVEFLKLVQERKITVLPIVPPIILALAKHPVVDTFNLSSVRLIVSGAAPLSADLQMTCAKRLKCVVKQGYGMTETSPVTTAQLDEETTVYPGSCGKLVHNTELKIVDTTTGEEKDVNQEGELCFKGPQVMKGYLNNPTATAETIKNGFIHTGDVGYIDGEGNIFIVDRVKELIKYNGYQVPPAELEAILIKHELIADAAVVGVPDEAAGEIPKAYVVMKPNQTLSAEEIIKYVEAKVAPQKKIRLVEFTDQIPKSPTGKILRKILKQKEREAYEATKQKLQ